MMERDDLVLLACLRKNARSKLTHISRETDMPVSTIFEKLKGAVGSYVRRYTCLLNNNELGFSSRVTLIIKVDKELKDGLSQFLQKHQNVNNLYRINNGYDFLVDAIFRQMIDLEEFIELLEAKFKVKHKEVYFIIDELRQEGFLSGPEALTPLFGQPPVKAAKKAKGKR